MAKDPVCGMEVDPKRAAGSRTHDHTTFFFCSQGCLKAFDSDSHRYGHSH